MPETVYPMLRAIADTGVLVEFGDSINDETHQRVLDFDAAVASANIVGFTEATPSYTSVLVGYNPLETDYDIVCDQLQAYLHADSVNNVKSTQWTIPVCYAEALAPDIVEFAAQLELSPDEIANHHCSGNYKIYMYGFAPGYAYMGGVPKPIQLPRKQAPVMNVPPRTVMVAGPQCLITTLTMPTGWWRIGMTTTNPLNIKSNKPFQFGVGDTLVFEPMSENDFLKHSGQS